MSRSIELLLRDARIDKQQIKTIYDISENKAPDIYNSIMSGETSPLSEGTLFIMRGSDGSVEVLVGDGETTYDDSVKLTATGGSSFM